MQIRKPAIWIIGALILAGALSSAEVVPPVENQVDDLQFSRQRGFYSEPFDLIITTDTPGARIYYTLDGSRPTQATGRLHRGAVPIAGTTLVRAIGILDGSEPSPEVTHSYLFMDEILHQPANPPGLPGTWGTDSEVGIVPTDYEMGGDVVRGVVDGVQQEFSVEEALLSLPSMSIVTTMDDLFSLDRGIYTHPKERGDAWEREVSVELIYPDGREGWQVRAGLKMQGNSSRRPFRMQKHSFRLDFQGDYGFPRLDEDIIPGATNEGFNKLILRACFTDSWGLVSWSPSRYRPDDSQYIRDVWMKTSHMAMGHPAARSTFVHLYVNGLYWGLYNPCERLDEAFTSDYLGGEETDWDILHDGGVELRAGTREAWNQLQRLADQGFASMEAYLAVQGLGPDGRPDPELPNLLNVESLADYMLVHFHAHAEDWPHNNWYAARSRIDGTGFRFFTWDQEICLDNFNLNRINNNPSNNPARIFQSLRQNEEFRLFFADRIYKHLFHEGALSETANRLRYRRLAAQIDPAIVAESARWGDVSQSIPFTRDNEWITERNYVLNEYIPRLNEINMERFRNAGLYPDYDPPQFSVRGGPVPRGTLLEMQPPEGVTGRIYYTLDGSDPRLPAWEQSGLRFTSATAKVYRTPIEMNDLTHVRARFFDGEGWSALNETVIEVGLRELTITEIHYNPADPTGEEVAAGWDSAKEFEFIELTNVGDAALNLAGWSIADGITFDFNLLEGNLQILEAGATMVLVENQDAFEMRYGSETLAHVFGQFGGALSNSGERIVILDDQGEEQASIVYGDQAPWPEAADGVGSSLELVATGLDLNNPASWQASAMPHGSPGVWVGAIDSFEIQSIALESDSIFIEVDVNTLPSSIIQSDDPESHIEIQYKLDSSDDWNRLGRQTLQKAENVWILQVPHNQSLEQFWFRVALHL